MSQYNRTYKSQYYAKPTTEDLILDEYYIWWDTEEEKTGKVIQIIKKTRTKINCKFFDYNTERNDLTEIQKDVFETYNIRVKHNKIDISIYTLQNNEIYDFNKADIL